MLLAFKDEAVLAQALAAALGMPLVYELDANLKPISRRYLGE